MTIQSLLATVPEITSSIEQGARTAVEEIEEAQLNPAAEVDQASEAFGALKQGYEEEKARQAEETKTP